MATAPRKQPCSNYPRGEIGSINKVMTYILYKTTNLVNGKYYIGVTNGNDPFYKGSGVVLKEAMKQYGSENFKREIIATFKNELEAYAKEAEIVNKDFVNNRQTYNIKVGGKGGTGQQKSKKHKDNIRQSILKKYANNEINKNGGRKPATDPVLLKKLVAEHGYKKTAEILGISFDACKSRYHRNK
jgi:hypothetical protein